MQAEALARRLNATLIRINAREAEAPADAIAIAAGARQALAQINVALADS